MASQIESGKNYIGKLKELLGCAEKYRELTKQQKKALDDDNSDVLLASLKKRGELIKMINTLNGELSAMQANPDSKGAQEAAKISADTKALFKESLELDKNNMSTIENLMRQTSEQGKNISKSRDGIEKYAQKNIQLSPGYFDKRQ